MPVPHTVPTSFKAPPVRELFTKAYWDGLNHGKLMLQVCGDCARITHPPGPVCSSCLSDNVTYREAKGLGTVYAFTVSHRPLHEEFKKDLPYVVALVDLDEGVRIMTWLVGCKPEDMRIGMRVKATYERITDEIALHRFQPAQD